MISFRNSRYWRETRLQEKSKALACLAHCAAGEEKLRAAMIRDAMVAGLSSTAKNSSFPTIQRNRAESRATTGKPDAIAPRWEEALQSLDYVWTRLPETMKLECGRYRGRRSVFAIGVTFERAAR